LRDGIDYPDDHLSFMCEFMAVMSRRIATSLENSEYRQAQSDLDASLAFLDDHILSWFDDFTAVANLILKTRFYRGVMRMSRAFFEFDEGVIADMQTEIASLND
jgi:TorA maturation chaperone TorD